MWWGCGAGAFLAPEAHRTPLDPGPHHRVPKGGWRVEVWVGCVCVEGGGGWLVCVCVCGWVGGGWAIRQRRTPGGLTTPRTRGETKNVIHHPGSPRPRSWPFGQARKRSHKAACACCVWIGGVCLPEEQAHRNPLASKSPSRRPQDASRTPKTPKVSSKRLQDLSGSRSSPIWGSKLAKNLILHNPRRFWLVFCFQLSSKNGLKWVGNFF